MKTISKKQFVYLIFAVGLIAIVLNYYVYKSENLDSKESLVALAFVESSHSYSSLVSENWAQSGFALKMISECNVEDSSQNYSCVLRYLNNIKKTVDALNTKLIVIGEGKFPSLILRAIDEAKLFRTVSALVFLQSDVMPELPEEVDLPKILLISSANDSQESILINRRFAAQIRAEKNWSWFSMLIDESSQGLLNHRALPLMVLYLADKKVELSYELEFDAELMKQNPLNNNAEYFEIEEAIGEYPVDDLLLRTIKAFLHHEPYLIKQWPLKKYKAFDLLKYRALLPTEKQGRYVTFANRKGHRFYLDLNRYGRYQPELVVALDDDENLYHLTSFYRTKRYYSWEEGGPDENTLYAESLGAFIHFRKLLPAKYELPYLQYSSILFSSIEFTDKDPYADLKNLTLPTFRVLTMNCIPCHSVGEVGGAAHHVEFRTGAPSPGFAQPLTTYSQEVLSEFFYNQVATANLIGVNPNFVDRPVADELITWLSQQ